MGVNTQNSQSGGDQRIRVTKTMLREALLQLLGEKPMQRISVKELCARAGVNRGTFYLHYQDIPALLERMEADMLADLDALLLKNQVIVSGSPSEAAGGFMTSLFSFLERNRSMCAVLLGDNGDKKFLDAIIERGREKNVREYRERYPRVSKRQAETFYSFVAWGFIGMIQYSLKNPAALSPAQMAHSARLIVEGGARFFEAGEG